MDRQVEVTRHRIPPRRNWLCGWFCGLVALGVVTAPAASRAPSLQASGGAPTLASRLLGPHLADYDAELRRPDGRVDIDTMVTRLKELGVTTYYWLIWHAATDWDDLKLFLPLMYFDEIRAKFAEDYREVVDGVVVAYLQDREEIEWTWAILNDAAVVPPSELSYPWNTPSRAGDFVMASQSARVLPADRYVLAFRERDDFTGPTSGYHFKQLLVDGIVVWEEDVAGGPAAWRKVAVDVTGQVRGKTAVSVAFRLFDKQGVSNFGVRWHLSELRAENLELATDLAEPGRWKVERQGAFEAGFGGGVTAGRRRFHIPFFSMTAGDEQEFRQRHGDPATPERIAAWLRTSLQAWRDGKCDGVVTYCLDKRPESRTFPLARQLFQEFRTSKGETP